MMNRGGQRFQNTTTERINHGDGMGSDVGELDNDGDCGWFVTAISPSSIPKHRTTERMRAGERQPAQREHHRVGRLRGHLGARWCPRWSVDMGSLLRGFRNLRKPRHLPQQWIRGGRAGAGKTVDGERSQDSVRGGGGPRHHPRRAGSPGRVYGPQRRWHVDILIGNHALAPTVYENNGEVGPEV